MTTTTDPTTANQFLMEQLRTDLIGWVQAACAEELVDLSALLRFRQLQESGAVPGGTFVPWGVDEFQPMALIAQHLDLMGRFELVEATAQFDWAEAHLGETTRTAIDTHEGDWAGAIGTCQTAEWDLRAAMDRFGQRGREA